MKWTECWQLKPAQRCSGALSERWPWINGGPCVNGGREDENFTKGSVMVDPDSRHSGNVLTLAHFYVKDFLIS